MNVKKFKESDRTFWSDFAFRELDRLNAEISRTEGYKEKCEIFDYMDTLFGLLIKLYPSRDAIPSDKSIIANESISVMKRERFLEELIEHLFSLDTIGKYDVEKLIDTLREITDETHKGQLYGGLLHFKDRLDRLAPDARADLGSYIAAEMERYINNADNTDAASIQNLEVVCDVCRYFIDDRFVDLLERAIALGLPAISFYAVESLVIAGKTPASETVDVLAHDLTYADLTYHVLERHGMQSLFPSELADPVYLAKSDLVHWLTYPTELGCEPDEIEYLGEVTSKKELYHIFRYRSDSDNLGDDLKGKWLIGWSSRDGGTFSQFHEYESFVKKTPEKTLKNIRKKEIG